MQIDETVHGRPVGRRCGSPDRQVGDPGSPSQIRTTSGPPPLVAATGRAMKRFGKRATGTAAVRRGSMSACCTEEEEAKESKDRVEDAMHATRAAVEEGIVPGGDAALLYAAKALDGLNPANDDQRVGI